MRSVAHYCIVENDRVHLESERHGSLLLYKPALTGEFKDVKSLRCTVVAPPERPQLKGVAQHLRAHLWDRDREPTLREGDVVYVHYRALEPVDVAQLRGGAPLSAFQWEGKSLFRVPYEFMLALERDGKLIPLAGHVIVDEMRPVMETPFGKVKLVKNVSFAKVVAVSPSAVARAGQRHLREGDVVICHKHIMVCNFHSHGERVRRYGVIGIEDVLALVEGARVEGRELFIK